MDATLLQSVPVDALTALAVLGALVLVGRLALRVAWKLVVVAALVVVGLWVFDVVSAPFAAALLF
ncbi:hypothetical protein [Halomarina ordinaria]|uniref:Uncharacterized protein n=1 Tax=Halomarina ordinaria TaxID=3033939 RepID=A0ABD5UB81_9EURY|nr:hypothetical protein [Halomarina sp. PSRA2]